MSAGRSAACIRWLDPADEWSDSERGPRAQPLQSFLLKAALISFIRPVSGCSWPDPVLEGAGPSARRDQVRPLAEQAVRVARVDDLLDPERLGRAERRAQLRQPLLDLRHLHPGIGRRVDLRAIRGLDPTLERQRAPAAGRPGVAGAVAAAVTVRGAGDAEAVAHDHRAPRDR